MDPAVLGYKLKFSPPEMDPAVMYVKARPGPLRRTPQMDMCVLLGCACSVEKTMRCSPAAASALATPLVTITEAAEAQSQSHASTAPTIAPTAPPTPSTTPNTPSSTTTEVMTLITDTDGRTLWPGEEGVDDESLLFKWSLARARRRRYSLPGYQREEVTSVKRGEWYFGGWAVWFRVVVMEDGWVG